MSAAPKLASDPTPEPVLCPARSGPRAIPLVAIVGPTASGKSTLGAWLARKFGGEVLACDSTQVYRGFDIGTAKPTGQERDGVPHHMLDLVDPGFAFTAGEYRLRAIEVLEDLRQRARLPILTVGTGLYLRALLEGLADAPARSEELRALHFRRSIAPGERAWKATLPSRLACSLLERRCTNASNSACIRCWIAAGLTKFQDWFAAAYRSTPNHSISSGTTNCERILKELSHSLPPRKPFLNRRAATPSASSPGSARNPSFIGFLDLAMTRPSRLPPSILWRDI